MTGALSCAAGPTNAPTGAADPAPGDLAAAYLRFGAALTGKDYTAAVAAIREVARLNPGDDAPEYLAAVTLAAGGRAQEAVAELRRLAAAGSQRVPQAHDFPGLAAERLQALAAATQANLPPSRSVVAFTLVERDLIPEGIAYDPRTAMLFVGSMYRRKIVAVASDGSVRDLVPAGTIDSPLGMRVDVERRSLWVATDALTTMEGYRPELRGRSTLLEIDVDTGSVRRSIFRGNQRNLLNDVVVDPAGTCYVTDSDRGEVLRLDPGAAEFAVLIPEGEVYYPNGLALADDARTLFVADFVRGLTAVDLASAARTTLRHPAGVFTHGFDGLYYREGALIGVDNGAGQGRVVRLHLSPTRDAVVRIEVLEAGHPSFASRRPGRSSATT